jgi:hypothetical protein
MKTYTNYIKQTLLKFYHSYKEEKLNFDFKNIVTDDYKGTILYNIAE